MNTKQRRPSTPWSRALFCENISSPTAAPCVAGPAHAHVILSVPLTSALSFIFLCLSLLSVSLVVEDALSVSDCSSLPAGLISDQRPVSISYVCWYRMQSLSFYDILQSNENQLSGNLLRKFKNSNGWQKLWVVFTNFCMFFYKSHQDNHPLASLPLLGYSLTLPSESENIHKDYVFKLHFKSHVYYFRAESEYTFERWMEVIRSATSSASRTRALSHKEPHAY
uniref:FERM, ARH/RhoGEF and pleckstrin domain protein 1 n=1 Tax=Ficedula albicollis TaxID=59894 RepID=A0A803VMH6_FICAL